MNTQGTYPRFWFLIERAKNQGLSLATPTPIDNIKGGRSDIKSAVLGMRKATAYMTSNKHTEGDIVFYKAHHLSKGIRVFTQNSHPSGGD